jgi:hypothetical protein
MTDLTQRINDIAPRRGFFRFGGAMVLGLAGLALVVISNRQTCQIIPGSTFRPWRKLTFVVLPWAIPSRRLKLLDWIACRISNARGTKRNICWPNIRQSCLPLQRCGRNRGSGGGS